MSNQYILALDQGTTSSRSLIVDAGGQIISIAQKEFKQHYPQPGWVEHDADEIWSTQSGTISEALAKAKLHPDQIAAIGITNQRETTVVWDRQSGHPIHPAIVWQDRRTADYCDQLKKQGREEMIQQKTGLLIDAYFSATKLKWILDQVPGARAKAEKGDLAFGTIDSWLIWNLTKGKVHATDVSNASRTMLYNIHELCWDADLLALFDIPAAILPAVRSSSEIYGKAILNGVDPSSGIPIAGLVGDQQAALFGQLCTEPGMAKNTYGTGCFMMMNTGEKAITSKNKLLTTIAWQINGKTHYALEGSVFIAGAVVQWLRDELKIIRNSSEVEALAAQVADSNGVYLVPAFAGLGAPHWNPHARGSIFGLTRGSNQSHIARAALDSIAFQTADVLQAMNADAGIPIKELRVDGGATINNALMQFQSDLLNCRVIRPKITETTALGAAYLAGLAVGFWKDLTALQSNWQKDSQFEPACTEAQRSAALSGWHRAVRASIAWAESTAHETVKI
ncbi:MAG: glycerol kinase GlpK [Bacteroidetes bacterium]|nr:glycerol kinase GlpK [Bacteroidota bacterium]